MTTCTLTPPTNTHARIDLATRYLKTLWGDTSIGYCLLWRLSDQRSRWYPARDYARLAADAVNLSADDVYLGCGLSDTDRGMYKRGSANQVYGIPGLWADVDFLSGDAHTKKNLPPDVESAIDLAQSACLPPSLIVHSGHGIYPWWLLQSPWIFGADADRNDAAQLLKDWQAHLMTIAEAREQTIDATSDLARVLRLPGTINHKQTPLPVSVEIPATIKRYDLAEIRAALDYPKIAEPKSILTMRTTGPASLDDDELIRLAGTFDNGEKFRQLWQGDISGYGSASEADLALCSLLAFATDLDPNRTDALFRRSGLMRKKWDERHYSTGETYGARTITKALHGKTEGYKGRRPRVTLARPAEQSVIEIHQGVTITVTAGRRTNSGKITATLAIAKDGARIDMVTVTSVPSSRASAAKAIAQHVPDAERSKIDALLGTLLSQANELADREVIREGETMQQIVERIVSEDFRPAYRTPGGFFSETRGQEIRRQDLVNYTPSRLVDAASLAADAPHNDGEIVRGFLLRAIKSELEIVFSDLVCSLPMASDADLAEHSHAAREFQTAMERVLTTPKTWEVGRDGNPARRASLISRAAEAMKNNLGNTKKWRKVLDACDIWWRIHTDDLGELQQLIAIRWSIAHQIGVPLPGVASQDDLTSLGTRYGVIEAVPGLPPKTEGGKTRVAILARAFVDPILARQGDLHDDEKTDTKEGGVCV